MHLGCVLCSFADLGLVKQSFWFWMDLLIYVGIGWLLPDLGWSQLG